MYTLYYSPGACSMAVHVLLNELNQPMKLESASTKEGKNRTPEFLKINPRGQVPVLVDDGHIMREGGAILAYLCDKHNSPLLPREGITRSEALEWLMFCNSTLHPAYGKCFWLAFNKDVANAPGREDILKAGIAQINKLWEEVEQRLSTRSYLCGEQPTVGDILLTVIGNWSGRFPYPINLGPKTKALFSRIIKRPSYQKALATEQVEYQMAS